MSPFLTEASDREVEHRSTDTILEFPHITSNPRSIPASVDPFTITTQTGFMPLQSPQVELPPAFKALTLLCEEMPIVKLDGTPGLLATFKLGPTIDEVKPLPDLTDEVDNVLAADGRPDLVAVTAIFRDYAFLASAYLLEPCWERYCSGLEDYGLGRAVLPKCIAGPLYKTAKLIEIPPFMSYAAAYSLFNYQFEDPQVGFSTYENLRMIRAFEKGLDPLSSEAGFVLTHVDIVKHTGGLIEGAVGLLDSVAAKESSNEKVIDSFELMLNTMHEIEASMEKMWAHSKPKEYISYRTFIFGITNQSMFPEGVVYEGVSDKAMYFRGESGANDSIIPLLDSLLQIPMPQNPLTEILKDFRNYRPKPHRDFLTYVRTRSEEVAIKDYCLQTLQTKVLYLRLLEHVRSFRWRHWLFAREYILRHTAHPTATGGSPIVTWLPNQLFAVMGLMQSMWESISEADQAVQGKTVNEMMANVYDSDGKLHKEVEKWCKERGV